jgi:hypothetical protein
VTRPGRSARAPVVVALATLPALCGACAPARPATPPPTAPLAAPRDLTAEAFGAASGGGGPERSVDVAPLLAVGCSGSGKVLDCTKVRVSPACAAPARVVDALSGLGAGTATVTCDADDHGALDAGLGVVGCGFASQLRRYLVASRAQGAQLVASEADLSSRFAPVDSAAKALAFAVAVSGARAPRVVTAEPGGSIGPTRVTTRDDGWDVRLFDVLVCGCGKHPWVAIDLHVSRAGAVREFARTELFEDASLAGACVD